MTDGPLQFVRVQDGAQFRELLDLRARTWRRKYGISGHEVTDEFDFRPNAVHIAALLRGKMVGGIRCHVCPTKMAASPSAAVFEDEASCVLHCAAAVDISQPFCARLGREISHAVRLGLLRHAVATGARYGVHAALMAVEPYRVISYGTKLGFLPMGERRLPMWPDPKPRPLLIAPCSACAEAIEAEYRSAVQTIPLGLPLDRRYAAVAAE